MPRQPYDPLVDDLRAVYEARREVEARLHESRRREAELLEALADAGADMHLVAHRVADVLGYGRQPAALVRLRNALRQRRRRHRDRARVTGRAGEDVVKAGGPRRAPAACGEEANMDPTRKRMVRRVTEEIWLEDELPEALDVEPENDLDLEDAVEGVEADEPPDELDDVADNDDG